MLQFGGINSKAVKMGWREFSLGFKGSRVQALGFRVLGSRI